VARGPFRLTRGPGLQFPSRGGPFALAALPLDALPLDGLPASAAAFSLRRLRTAYEGPAVRVRRSSDNAEADIGFTAEGELDTVALLAHVGLQNLLLRSEEFDNAAWVKNNASVTPNTATAPNGGETVDYFVPAASGTPDLRQLRGFVAADYSLSIVVKKDTYAPAGINFALAGTAGANGTVNIETGATIGAPGARFISGESAHLGNGYYRVQATITNTFVGNSNAVFSFRNATNSTLFGDGTSGIFIWGAQLNTGATAQPYAATTTTARDGNGFVTTWYDQSGNARDAVQATASAQPRIVNAGVVETMGGRPAVVWSGAQVLTAAEASFGAVREFSSVLTFARRDATTGIPGNRCVFGNRVPGSGQQGRIFRTTTEALFTANIGQGFASLPYVNDTPVVASIVNAAGANLLLRSDGGADASSANTLYSVSPMPMQLGADGRNTEFFVGAAGEFAFFDVSLNEANRRALERSQGAYYGVVVA